MIVEQVADLVKIFNFQYLVQTLSLLWPSFAPPPPGPTRPPSPFGDYLVEPELLESTLPGTPFCTEGASGATTIVKI